MTLPHHQAGAKRTALPGVVTAPAVLQTRPGGPPPQSPACRARPAPSGPSRAGDRHTGPCGPRQRTLCEPLLQLSTASHPRLPIHVLPSGQVPDGPPGAASSWGGGRAGAGRQSRRVPRGDPLKDGPCGQGCWSEPRGPASPHLQGQAGARIAAFCALGCVSFLRTNHAPSCCSSPSSAPAPEPLAKEGEGAVSTAHSAQRPGARAGGWPSGREGGRRGSAALCVLRPERPG